MKHPAIAAALLFMALMMAMTTAVRAETFCVEDHQDLLFALHRVGITPESDVIRLRTGTYRVAGVDGFSAIMEGSLEITGGWAAGCLFRQRGARSTIDGEYERAGLIVLARHLVIPNTLRIAHMTFRRGVSDDRGGLSIYRTGGAAFSVVIENSRFIDNHVTDHTDEYGAGLFVEADEIRVFGNVFRDNDATDDGGAAYLSCIGQNAAFNSNTVTMNTAGIGQPGRTGGVMLRGCAWEVANNILWNNEGHDLNVVSTEAVAQNNNIGSSVGTIWSDGSNLSVDPQFTSTGQLRLRRSSPLIDAGLNDPDQGLPLFSHDGGPRIVGPAIDIGAYELDVLFADDFDPLMLVPDP